MTITTQYRVFGGIDDLDDRRPGTRDVRWAEDALDHHRPPLNRSRAVSRPPQLPPRRALRRLVAGLVIAVCLVVAIVIAPGGSASAPGRTPTPAAATSRPASVTSTNTKSFGPSGLFACPLGQPTSPDARSRALPCPEIPPALEVPRARTAVPGLRRGDDGWTPPRVFGAAGLVGSLFHGVRRGQTR